MSVLATDLKFLISETDWRDIRTSVDNWPDDGQSDPARYPCMVITFKISSSSHYESPIVTYCFFIYPDEAKKLLDLVPETLKRQIEHHKNMIKHHADQMQKHKESLDNLQEEIEQ